MPPFSESTPDALVAANRVVIKIGSSLLFAAEHQTRLTWLNSLADDIAELVSSGKDVIVVSSGAIAMGRNILKSSPGKLRLDQKQAAAAVGQVALSRLFQEVFEQRNIKSGQVLLTYEDTEQRLRYLNARSTINSLLDFNVVPVVNENDTVATAEIRYGDNDRLSARVASMCSADLLVILSDVDGLFSGPPDAPESQFISTVTEIDAGVEAMAGDSVSAYGTGGMATKIQAAKIATQSGAAVIIASGCPLNPIARLSEADTRFTIFAAKDSPASARKKWIAGDLSPSGKVVIDQGAAKAIGTGGSLLPIGVVGLDGQFSRGEIVEITSQTGTVVARGISAYDRSEAENLIGKRTDDFESVLGYRGPENLIHRDDMVVFSNGGPRE